VTPAARSLATFAIILAGLAGRAGVDKILALRGGPDVVAHWAQLQSAVDLVCGVALAGIGAGLTVLVTQARQDDLRLLRFAIRPALGTSLAAALLLLASSPGMAGWLTGGAPSASLVVLAAAGGYAAVLPGLLSAYWLGRHRQDLILLLSLLGLAPLLAAALLSAIDNFPRNGLIAQGSVALTLAVFIAVWLRGASPPASDAQAAGHAKRQLMRYLPVGIAIGLLSPAAAIAVRGLLSASLTWSDAGFVQALWRASEWVTGSAAGVLSLLFLSRLSAAWGGSEFRRELARAGLAVLVPAAVLLLAIYANQKTVLTTLYDVQFLISDRAAALFLLGDWLRIASWVFLYALYAMRRTALIIAGEVFSLPLYALLLYVYAGGMTLERAGLLYLLSYLVYVVFNAVAVMRMSRQNISPATASHPCSD
jgi:PST family polysaccharide transporter